METEKDWFDIVQRDWSRLPDCLDYFNKQGVEARHELTMVGRLEDHSKRIPANAERRFSQLQIVNALVRYFEIKLEAKRSEHFKRFLENYDRQLSARDAEKYVDGVEEVVNLNLLINEICLVRNIFVGITKGVENKSFQINNIVKLRAAGLEDARIE